MGVKKSTVCTKAPSGVSLYTPASSAVSNPTSTFSFAQRGIRASTWSKTFGLSLDAQPAAEDWAVRRFFVGGTTSEYKEFEGDKEYEEYTPVTCNLRRGALETCWSGKRRTNMNCSACHPSCGYGIRGRQEIQGMHSCYVQPPARTF